MVMFSPLKAPRKKKSIKKNDFLIFGFTIKK